MRSTPSNQMTDLWSYPPALWGQIAEISYRRERLLDGVAPRGRHLGAVLLSWLRREQAGPPPVSIEPTVIQLPRQGGERDVALEPQLR